MLMLGDQKVSPKKMRWLPSRCAWLYLPRASIEITFLVPGLVVGNAQAGNGGGPIFKLVGLFIKSHAAHQVVGALCRSEPGIQIGCLLRLGGGGKDSEGKGENQPAAKRHGSIPLWAAVGREDSLTVTPLFVP